MRPKATLRLPVLLVALALPACVHNQVAVAPVAVEAEPAVVQVQTAQVQNQVTLYKVLGGGWK